MKIPQMAPMNWFILFLYFNFGLYLTICKLFYLSSLIMKESNKKFNPSLNLFNFYI